jgi:hypothetical protein
MPLQLIANSDIQSATTFTFSNTLFGLGSAASPSIAFTGDTNTGIFSPAADTLAFAEGGTEVMRIDSSGNVGIGTVSPTRPLTVSGSATNLVNFASSGGETNLQISNSSSTGRSYEIISGGSGGAFAGGLFGIFDRTVSASRLSIDSSGNVGIGTNSVNNSSANNVVLEINSTNTSLFNLSNGGARKGYLYNDGTNIWLGATAASGVMRFDTQSTERMRIASGGNVGIGTNNPVLGLLDINGAGSTLAVRTPDTSSPTLALFVNAGSNGVGTISLDNGGIMTFDTGSTGAGQAERMRIASNGYVGIGTTAPFTYLQIDGTHVSGYGLLALNAASGTQYTSLSFSNNGTPRAFIFYDNTNNLLNVYGTAGRAVTITTNDTERMRFASDGSVGIGTASPSTRLHVRQNSGGTDATDCVAQFVVGDSSTFSGGILVAKNAGNRGSRGNGDGSALIKASFNNADAFIIDKFGNMQMDSGYGSAVTAYGCRAWVNFDGTGANGAKTIRASGGVSSIVKTATGVYTFNFSASMPDINYCPLAWDLNYGAGWYDAPFSVGSFQFRRVNNSWNPTDTSIISVAVFR